LPRPREDFMKLGYGFFPFFFFYFMSRTPQNILSVSFFFFFYDSEIMINPGHFTTRWTVRIILFIYFIVILLYSSAYTSYIPLLYYLLGDFYIGDIYDRVKDLLSISALVSSVVHPETYYYYYYYYLYSVPFPGTTTAPRIGIARIVHYFLCPHGAHRKTA
jgi:hypothetical protein